MAGSSPQVRGISDCTVQVAGKPGIIPAGAGHFPWRLPFFAGNRIIPAGAGHFAKQLARAAATGDHPRRCGAFPRAGWKPQSSGGSSPQVRGILRDLEALAAIGGIIPAGAGHFNG